MCCITNEQLKILDKFIEYLISSKIEDAMIMNSEEVNNYFNINSNSIDIKKFINDLPGVNLDKI